MNILAIDTSCDETAASVVSNRRVLSNVVYSQIVEHERWGGVVPSVAKRAHKERIDPVVDKALKKSRLKPREIDAIAVTTGPGIAIALEVGIEKAKTLSRQWNKPLISVNHMEGHIYSCFVQNSNGKPDRAFEFPYLALLVSGGHTEIVLFTNHLQYEVIGRTVDDAAGEALDKAAKMLGFGYPGGPIIERLAEEVNNRDYYTFTRPMLRNRSLDFSFSGLKTTFLYHLRELSDDEKLTQTEQLASSFQEAVFDLLLRKLKRAVETTGIKTILVGGGVGVNVRLRNLLRRYVKFIEGTIFFPPYKYLNFDNAAMIGVASCFKAEAGQFVQDIESVDRVPRLSLPAFQTVETSSKFLRKREYEKE